MEVAKLPPAVVNSPPAYTLLPDAANAYTYSFIPEPRADQLVPFHCAMRKAWLPPAVSNSPPAYTLLPDTASAYTKGPNPPSPPDNPEPRADQLLPFHCAMLLAAMPPAFVNTPPAYNVLPDTASAYTYLGVYPGTKGGPTAPVPLRVFSRLHAARRREHAPRVEVAP